jgi:hypothetical protein
MSRWRKSFFGNRGFGVNMIACFCFLMLAVYGWGLSWQEVGNFLLMLIILFAAILIPAFLLGWLWSKFRK